jgi:hypothetical protein
MNQDKKYGAYRKTQTDQGCWLKVISGSAVEGKLGHITEISVYHLCVVWVLNPFVLLVQNAKDQVIYKEQTFISSSYRG